MNAKVLRVLEYDKVIRMLEGKATSDPHSGNLPGGLGSQAKARTILFCRA